MSILSWNGCYFVKTSRLWSTGSVVLVSFLLALFAISVPIASAVPQISVNSPLNQSYGTGDITINITQVEASPEMMWYTFPQEDWLMFRENPNRTGYTDNFNPPELVKLWNYTIGTYVVSSPAVSDGVVYIGSWDGSLYAFYLNGTLKWSYATGLTIKSSPSIADGIVYVGSDDSYLHAVYANNGTLKWKYGMAGGLHFTSPVVANNVVYVGSNDDNLYAIYANNGTQKWNYSTGGDIFSSPAVSDGVVYVGSSDNKLYAIYINGTLKWNYTTGGEIRSSPAISDNIIYVGSWDSNLYAIYTNGTKRWNYTTGYEIYSSPAISNGVVYVGSVDNKLYAIYTNGSLKWSYTTGGGIEYSSSVVTDEVVYIGSHDGKVYAIYLNGTKKWDYATGGTIDSSPAVVNGMIFIGSDDDNIYAFGDGSSTNSLSRDIVLPNGVYEIEVFSRNTTGDYNTSIVYFTVNDVSSPTVTIYNPQNTTYNALLIPLDVSSPETIDTWWYSLDGGSNTTFIPNTTITVTEIANHIEIYANDTAGNVGGSSIDFTVDIPPQMTVYSPQNTTYASASVSLQVSAHEPVDTWWYSLDGASNVTFIPNATITAAEGSPHAIIIYANDTTLGNENSSTVYFTLAIPPQIIFNSPLNLTYNDTLVVFNITQLEANPEVLWYTFPQEEWPMFMLDANNTGYTSNFNPPNLINVWSYDTLDEIRAGAAVSDGVVYFGTDRDDFYAVDLNGTVRWSLDLNSDVRSTPAIVDGVVYVGSRDTDLYAIDVNGTIRWQYNTGHDLDSSPTVIDGVVYIGSLDDNLYAIYTNGTLKWSYATGGDIYSTPAVVGDVVYVGSNDFSLYAIDTNGTLRWSYATGGQVRSSPSYFDGVIYVGSRDSDVYAFYENGTLKWSYNTGWQIDVTPIVVDDEVFVASGDQWLYKLDLDGNLIKRYYPCGEYIGGHCALGGGNPSYPASQAVAGDTLYYGTDSDSIIAFYTSGDWPLKWNYSLGDNVLSAPAIAAGMLFVGSFDDSMYAFADGSATNSLERTFLFSNGVYEMRVISRDTLGNMNETTVHFTVNDVTPPQITIASPLDAVYAAFNVTLSVSAHEPVDTWWYNLNGAGNVTFTSDIVITGAEGLNNLIVYANDTVGNINSSEVDFTVTLPIPATGIYGLLTHAGSGTGYFLDAIREPTVDLVLGLGIVGGIIAIFTGLAFAITNMFSGSVRKF